MKTIVCVKWGQRYDDYVEKLKANCEKYGTFDRFYCLTDRPERDYDIALPTHWDKHFNPESRQFWAYRKCYMFNEDLFPEMEGDEFLFLDLDVLFHQSIDAFWELDMEHPWIIQGWWNDLGNSRAQYGKIVATSLNSSVIRWNRGQLKPIYDHINDNAEYIFFFYRTIDNYFIHHWYDLHKQEPVLFDVFPKGMIYSYYKGNIYPEDMELNKIRPECIVCLFNNSAAYGEKEIEHMWEIEEIKDLW